MRAPLSSPSFCCCLPSSEVRLNLIRGRLGNHRFHPMLVHFPSALYPFGWVMDLLAALYQEPGFSSCGMYALAGAIALSLPAALYGTIDFLQLKSESAEWKIAGIHALLNVLWL